MLELIHIYKDYYIDKKPFHALKDVNLFFPKVEFCAILGPSGCGKTTTLNIIGGLDRYTSGDLKIEGISTKTYQDKEWDNYRNKRIGFVFQNYNLIGHLSVQKNVELAMTLQGISKKERVSRARAALDSVGLNDIYGKTPNQLSGGQMQRVAIARALVNDPEIILADEPTGALDSKTSVQILDILKKISETKLVIMVTHNENLAIKYANRIIKFKDGVIESDSKNNESEVREKEEKEYNKFQELKLIDERAIKFRHRISKKRANRSSMNFWTSVKLAFENIKSKKGRTIMTSIASSFGIIGVALVLALNNGFTQYINRIESETASSLPISVPAYTINYENVDMSQYNQSTKFPDSEEIYPYITSSQVATAEYVYNNFSEKYFNFLSSLRDERGLINDFIVNYQSGYKYNLMTDFPESISGDTDGSVDFVNTSYSAGSISSVIGSVTGLPSTVFHVLYGQEEYIMDNYDLIDGTYPSDDNELVLVVDQYNRIRFSTLQKLGFYNSTDNYSQVLDQSLESKVKPISWDDVLNKKYKVFTNDELYDQQLTDSNNDSEDRQAYYYTKKSSDNQTLFDGNYGTDLKVVGILRPKKSATLSLMPEGLCFLSNFQDDLVEENDNSLLNTNAKNNIILKSGKDKWQFLNDLVNIINSNETISTTILQSQVNNLYSEYFDFYNFYGNRTISLSSFLSYCKNNAIDLVPSVLKNSGISDKGALISYLVGSFGNDTTRYDSVLGLVAYINSYSEIANITIFPKDLTSKSELLTALDEYNVISLDPNDTDHASSKSEQIYYTDIGSSLTDSLGQMINIITIVLVIFASISLVVSCVMTGIITYANVIERTKEIGILRAIGARKKDVGRLFQAECAIVGLVAGIIGCVVSYIASIPINQIINSKYAEYNVGNIADLSIYSALALIAISIALTFISSLIPSRFAAKKDPVVALRSE
jgi:putative ABC transport system permease protein